MTYWVVVGREMDGNELKHIRLLSDKGQRQTMTAKQLRSFQKNNTVVNVKYQGESLHGVGMEMRDIPTYQKQKGGMFQQVGGQTEQQIIQRSYPLIQQLQQKEFNKLQKQVNNEAQEKEELNKKRMYVVQKLIAIDMTMQYIGAMKDITNDQITNNKDIMRYLKQLDISNSDMSIESTIQTYGVKGLVNKLDESLDRLDHRSKKYDLTGLNISDVTKYQTIPAYINVLRPRVKQLIKKHEETYSLIKQNREENAKVEDKKKEQQKQAVKLEKALVNSVEDEDQDNVLIIDEKSDLSKEDLALLESLTGKSVEVKSKVELKKEAEKDLLSWTEIQDTQSEAVSHVYKVLKDKVVNDIVEKAELGQKGKQAFLDSDTYKGIKQSIARYTKGAYDTYVSEKYLLPEFKERVLPKYKKDGKVVSNQALRLLYMPVSTITDNDLSAIEQATVNKILEESKEEIQKFKKKDSVSALKEGLLTETKIDEIQVESIQYVLKTYRAVMLEQLIHKCNSNVEIQKFQYNEMSQLVRDAIKRYTKLVMMRSHAKRVIQNPTTQEEKMAVEIPELDRFILEQFLNKSGTIIKMQRMCIPKNDITKELASVIIGHVSGISCSNEDIRKDIDSWLSNRGIAVNADKETEEKKEKENLPSFTSIQETQSKSIHYIKDLIMKEVYERVEKFFKLDDVAIKEFESNSDVKEVFKGSMEKVLMSSRQTYVNSQLTIDCLERFVVHRYKHDGKVVSSEDSALMCIKKEELTESDIASIKDAVVNTLVNNKTIKDAAERFTKKAEKKEELDGLLTRSQIDEIQKDTIKYFWDEHKYDISQYLCTMDHGYNTLETFLKYHNHIYYGEELSDENRSIIDNEIKENIENTIKGTSNGVYVDNTYIMSELKPFVQDKHKHKNDNGTIEIVNSPMLVIKKEELNESLIEAINERVAKLTSMSKTIKDLIDKIKREEEKEREREKKEENQFTDDVASKIQSLVDKIQDYESYMAGFKHFIGEQLCDSYIIYSGANNSEVSRDVMVAMNLLCDLADALELDDPYNVSYPTRQYFGIRTKSKRYDFESPQGLDFDLTDETFDVTCNNFRKTLNDVIVNKASYIDIETIDAAFDKACEHFISDDVMNRYDFTRRAAGVKAAGTCKAHAEVLVKIAYEARDLVKSASTRSGVYEAYKARINELHELVDKYGTKANDFLHTAWHNGQQRINDNCGYAAIKNLNHISASDIQDAMNKFSKW